jgi:hypothetical protein
VPASHVDLTLPEAERVLVRSLIGPWRDLLYVPGPGLTTPLDPGAYRSSVVIVPAGGLAVRVSSVVAPAFGGELCRLRFEALPRAPAASLGSFFDLARGGIVYAFSADRGAGAGRAPERAEWRYGGPSLQPSLSRIRALRLLREEGRGAAGSWAADRGLVVTGHDGTDRLVLAVADPPEAALVLPVPGLHRILLDPAIPAPPGVTVRGLLGYAERGEPTEMTIGLRDP